MNLGRKIADVAGMPATLSLTNITSIVCDVHFGVPSASGDCLQIGICRIMPDVAPQQNTASAEHRRCQRAMAHASVTEEGYLSLYFSKSDLKPCTERAIFRNAFFPVPQAYQLPDSLLSLFPSSAIPEVPVGKYQISAVSGGYQVLFAPKR